MQVLHCIKTLIVHVSSRWQHRTAPYGIKKSDRERERGWEADGREKGSRTSCQGVEREGGERERGQKEREKERDERDERQTDKKRERVTHREE